MSTALVRYDGDKPRGVFGRLRGAMQKWALSQGGPELEARLARLVAPQNEYGVDPFGLELDFTKAAIAPVLWLYRNYFRVETPGIGQVVGTPENCRRLLAAGETIMVFPEGTRGLNKTYDKRYRLQEFGSGFMRIAVETQTPVLPVAVIGAEEQAPALIDFKQVAKIFGFPALPITPTLVPFSLPVKYHLWFGEPMRFSGTAHDDDAELERKVSEVKRAIETLLKRGLKSRGSIFR